MRQTRSEKSIQSPGLLCLVYNAGAQSGTHLALPPMWRSVSRSGTSSARPRRRAGGGRVSVTCSRHRRAPRRSNPDQLRRGALPNRVQAQGVISTLHAKCHFWIAPRRAVGLTRAKKRPSRGESLDPQPGRQRRGDPALDRADTLRARCPHHARGKVNNPWTSMRRDQGLGDRQTKGRSQPLRRLLP
jgi:hypothetical protein